MTTFIQHRRSIFITLLLGFIASFVNTSALADAAADYSGSTLHCVTCHGTPPGTGTYKFTVALLSTDYPTNGPTTDPTKAGLNGGAGLAAYITTNMPKDMPGMCSAACGQEMAHYLRPLNPVADASKSTNRSGAAPLTTQFDASNSNCDISCSSYTWNFGDNSTGSGVTTSHTYTAAGTYTATLTVTDAQSKQSSTTVTITVSAVAKPPVANASRSSNLSGTAPLTVNLDASLSTCPDGCTQFASYGWTFDANGSSGSSVGVTTTHTYTAVGTHTITLTVTDDQGLKSSTTLTATVSASSRPPVAKINTITSNVKGAVPLNATFDAAQSSCDDGCSSYAWNFGDGTTATFNDGTTSASHTYTTAGNYTATLTVTDAGNGKKTSTTVQVIVVPAESLTSYVQACQSQLNFQNVSIPNLDCYDGDLFVKSNDPGNDPVNDYLGYKSITDQVDLAFACRWLFGSKTARQGAITVELLLYNRQNGNTCFFSAKTPTTGLATQDVSSLITSPTDPAAASFWATPAFVDANVRCVGCHVSGPYIATPLIAEYLAKDGLLNNGHDTLSNTTTKYHAISATVNGVPGAFSQWDSLKQSYIDPVQSTCSQGCHMIGTLSPQSDLTFSFRGPITILANPASEVFEINQASVMPPYDDGSDYRWINLDTPGDGVESETFAAAINATNTLVPQLFSNKNPNCAQPNNAQSVPYVMEAHVVGTENAFVIAQPGRFAFLPDKLSVFNLKDGLVCLNADQEPGTQCQDYRVHYECTDPSGNKTWTDWYNMDSPSGDGDHEERSKDANVCTSPAGSVATGIEAAITESANGWTYSSIGPNDRLASFSQYGLTCNNADQPDAKCSNYVVRFSSCGPPPPTVSRTLTNEDAIAGSKQLTAASGSLTKGQGHNSSWNTQQWNIEPVTNTEYVRLHNTGTNVYLTVTSTAEQATVGTAASNTTTNEMWLLEPVSNSTDFRLKNLFSGKYLTMADPNSFPNSPDYLPIYSQGRNTSWNTQRWIIQ